MFQFFKYEQRLRLVLILLFFYTARTSQEQWVSKMKGVFYEETDLPHIKIRMLKEVPPVSNRLPIAKDSLFSFYFFLRLF